MNKYIKYLSSFIVCFTLIFTLSGCSMGNTPTKKVENFLDSYRKNDSNVLTQLKDMIDSDNLMDENQKESYSDIIKKQYSDLTYEIKDERIDGDKATVTAEIEVYDFYKANKESEEYYNAHKDEFESNSNDNNNNTVSEKVEEAADDVKDAAKSAANKAKNAAENVGEALTSDSKYINYRLGKLKDSKDRVKYTIDFKLTKKNGSWVLDDIDDETRQKIHGLYEH